MNRIIRWTPNREIQSLWDSMDRMFSDNYPTLEEHARTWGLALDVVENEDAYVVKASLPGINPDDIDITMEKSTLTISGESRADETIHSEDYRLRERRYGSFSRSLSFPLQVNSDDIRADYENGVLTLTVPKAEEVKPKKIAVSINAK
jgi:HSP20 family protein